MSEMIEKVARVIAREHFSRKMWQGACSKEEWLNYSVDCHWKNHASAARAAIEAMREPTEGMLKAGDAMIHTGYKWQAMIDAALSPSSVSDEQGDNND